MPEQPSIHVEVQQKGKSTFPRDRIIASVRNFLYTRDYLDHVTQSVVCVTPEEFSYDAILKSHVQGISITDLDSLRISPNQGLNIKEGKLIIHVFSLNEQGPEPEQLGVEEELSAATHFMLPVEEFSGLWDNLIYDSDIKDGLLNYASSALLFSDTSVNSDVVTWNRVVLLHGPPGTGKTSLCKALAQKLSIRFSHRYDFGQLIEINSHSLFSKWFSESGKLVMKMFQNIEEYLDDPKALVFLLIDEVESLSAARKSASNGNEPSDAIRVVNALLTQIDRIKRYPNVIILTTSNLTGAIDLAFIDRADIKQYIGLPSATAICKIYESCLDELLLKGIIVKNESDKTEISADLRNLSLKSVGLSGRTLRKLPFIAHALFVRKTAPTTLSEFLVALGKAVDRQREERNHLAESS